MENKYWIYIFLFIGLVTFFTISDSSARKIQEKSDTIVISYDKINEEFFINEYNRVGDHRERNIIRNNIIIIDSTNMNIDIKICKDKTNECFKNKKSRKHRVSITNGVYRLKVNTNDLYPIKRNNFYLRKLNTR